MAWFEAAMARFSPVKLSFLFSFAEKYTLLLLGMASAMVIARVLTPAEIGVYSVGAVLAGLAQAVRDFGVGQYVIQEKELSRDKLRAALSTSIAVAWLLAVLVWSGSGTLASFYRQPQLRPVLHLLALNFVLIPFSSVTLPYLRRELRFPAIYAINTCHSVAQLACSVSLALLGFGSLSLAWAAVAGTVAALLASLLLRPAGLPWLPGVRGMRQILRFGALSTAGGVVDEIGVAAPDLIVGKLIGVADVGIFGKATGVLNIFNQLITSAISPVVYPLYAAQARSGGDVKQVYLQTVSYMAAMAWPFFGFLAVMAPSVLRVLYGPQWDAAVPLVRVMCISSGIYSMFSMARYLLVAIGHVKAQAQLDALAVPVRVVAILLAAPLGLVWVAWAVVLGALFRSALTYFYLSSLAGIVWRDLLKAVWRSALVAVPCVAGAWLTAAWLPGADGHLLLPLLAAAGATALLWLGAMLLVRHELAIEFNLTK
jgi:O-antigen/teichoic acid export membrane protein